MSDPKFPRVLFVDPTHRVRIVQRFEMMNEARPADCLTLERIDTDAMGERSWKSERAGIYGMSGESVEGVLAIEIAKRAIAEIDAPATRAKQTTDDSAELIRSCLAAEAEPPC